MRLRYILTVGKVHDRTSVAENAAGPSNPAGPSPASSPARRSASPAAAASSRCQVGSHPRWYRSTIPGLSGDRLNAFSRSPGPGPARCSSGPAITGPALHRAGGCASRWPHGPQRPLQARVAAGARAACRRASACYVQGTGPGVQGFTVPPDPPLPDPPPEPASKTGKTG
jgi:hypothetical protein